uniref:Uncharacterized protein n=1 Tax=Triticum urartu TaxID=4572 RepID=A0A8R7QW02_TRIUA
MQTTSDSDDELRCYMMASESNYSTMLLHPNRLHIFPRLQLTGD